MIRKGDILSIKPQWRDAGDETFTRVARSDEDLIDIARQELDLLMGINATPIFHRLFRWRNATPQYDVGHLQRVDAIEAALPAGLWVTGSPYRGIGIPDCVNQAQQSADKLWQQIAN